MIHFGAFRPNLFDLSLVFLICSTLVFFGKLLTSHFTTPILIDAWLVALLRFCRFCSDLLNENNGTFVLGVIFFFRQISTS